MYQLVKILKTVSPNSTLKHARKSFLTCTASSPSEAAVPRYSSKQVLLKLRNIHRKTPVLESLFNKAGRPVTLKPL